MTTKEDQDFRIAFLDEQAAELEKRANEMLVKAAWLRSPAAIVADSNAKLKNDGLLQ